MWRYGVVAIATLLLAGAGMFLFQGNAKPEAAAAPIRAQAVADAPQEPLPDTVPQASERTREEKRFDRYDKDRNQSITREEYLVSRRKAFARLDRNGDGKLDFDEWVVKTSDRFATADRDKSGSLTRAEFLTTAPKRRPKPACRCESSAKDGADD